MNYLLVGFGGMFGSLTRYYLGKWISEKSNGSFPYGTYLINITGALLLGIVSALPFGSDFYHLMGDGFLGAYTTFSTFMYEGVNLYTDSEKKNALLYVFSSLCLGILFYAIGYVTIHTLF